MARTVLITGATRGVGRGIADAFARRGDRLVLVARSTDDNPNKVGLPGTLESVAAELRELGSVDVQTITADLVQTAEAERVVHEVRASWGTPDVLVNNAAATFIGQFLDVPLSRWKTALALNLLAPVTLIHGFLPDMLERDSGRIINITSSAARTRENPPPRRPPALLLREQGRPRLVLVRVDARPQRHGDRARPGRTGRAHRVGRVPPDRSPLRGPEAADGTHGTVR